VPPLEVDEDVEQLDVVVEVEPEPVLERVPVPVQSLLLERWRDSSIDPARPGELALPVP
jgi:hypothetical protein